MQIEKIDNSSSPGRHYPGLVDIFDDKMLSNKNFIYFTDAFGYIHKEFLQGMQNRFVIGKEYGTKGVIIDLVCSQPSDIYYELCPVTLQDLPKNKIKYFLQNYNVIIHDYPEGTFMSVLSIHPIEYIRSLGIKPRNIILSSSSGDEIKDLTLNIKSGFVPIYLMQQYVPQKIDFNFNPSKLALIPVRKARSSRIKLLARLHEQDLLKECDWSLVSNTDEQSFDYLYTNKELDYNKLDISNEDYIKDFYNEYKSELPKVLSLFEQKTIDDHWSKINERVVRSTYNYYVAAEPILGGPIFATEKTWRGMYMGLPVLTLASAGFNRWLESLGFKTIGDFDHLDWDERIFAIVEFLQKPIDLEYNESVARHNYNLVYNKEFIFSLINIQE
jgi:hypothetical protein